MAQLWGGRFTKETDRLVYDFNASIGFDRRLFHEDIEGSMAHVTMLAKQGILTEGERDEILEGLAGIRQDVDAGKIEIDESCEDIHSFAEAELIRRIGPREAYLTHMSHEIGLHAEAALRLPPHVHPAWDTLQIEIPDAPEPTDDRKQANDPI